MNHTRYSRIAHNMTIYPAEMLAVEVLQQQQDLVKGMDLVTAVQQIRDIAESVCERLENSAALGDVLFALNDQLFNVLDFHCAAETQSEPGHSLLHDVLITRTAEPIALGVLYICVGRWLGLPLDGCTFLGQFLVRYQDDREEVLLDPSCGCIQLQDGDLFARLQRRFGEVRINTKARGFASSVNDHHLVVRVLRRLKAIYLQHGQPVEALRVQEKIMQLLPDQPGGFRERGQLYELLDCPHAAAEDYNRYLDMLPDAGDAISLSQRLMSLLRQPPVLH